MMQNCNPSIDTITGNNGSGIGISCGKPGKPNGSSSSSEDIKWYYFSHM